MKTFKIVGIIIVIIVTVIAGTIGKQLVNSLFHHNLTFDEQLMKIAEELNKSCPFLVDSDTQLDATIGGPGKTFTYKYTLINFSKDEIDSVEFVNLLRPTLINMIKTSKDMQIFREKLVTMNYTYYDKDGIFIAKIEIASEDYK